VYLLTAIQTRSHTHKTHNTGTGTRKAKVFPFPFFFLFLFFVFLLFLGPSILYSSHRTPLRLLSDRIESRIGK
jgi:hypothetical protein